VGFVRRSQVLDRMYCMEKDVSIAVARFARNVEVGVLGAGVLTFTCLDKRGKLEPSRVRVQVKVKRHGQVYVEARPLNGGGVFWSGRVQPDEAPQLITNLLVFEFVEPSAVDMLGALAAPL
jgi:hypothetical protein